jgi:hypothetical protein
MHAAVNGEALSRCLNDKAGACDCLGRAQKLNFHSRSVKICSPAKKMNLLLRELHGIRPKQQAYPTQRSGKRVIWQHSLEAKWFQVPCLGPERKYFYTIGSAPAWRDTSSDFVFCGGSIFL